MYAALSFVMMFLALCLQEFIPRLGESASYGVVLLFPVWFLCTAVTLPYPVMLGASFFAGLLWDLRHTVDPGLGPAGDASTGATPFGISILLSEFTICFRDAIYDRPAITDRTVAVSYGTFRFS